MSLRRRLEQFLRRRRPDYGPRYDHVVFVDSMGDLPENTGSDIYVVGDRQLPKWVVLNCPCLRGHQLRVPLMRTSNPRWRLTLTRNKATLYPSVVVAHDPCSSHFWLADSRVEWARWARESH